MMTDKDERWTFGHALHVEDPNVGNFIHAALYSRLSLGVNQSNWVLASIPTPNVTQGWKISSIMLRYTIRGFAWNLVGGAHTADGSPVTGGPGIIDKIGIRDGDVSVHEFGGLQLTFITGGGWETLALPLPEPKQ